MAFDYRINAQAPKAGIDPFQAGQRMGGGFGRLASGVVDTYNQGKQEEENLVKKQKVDALVMKFNNPESPEFKGLSPKQRSLKLSRLLAPLDEAMSGRYEQQARSIDEKTSLFEQQENLKRMGLKKDAKNKFNAKLGSLFRNIQDKESWDREKAKWSGETELFIPDWESGTREAWIEDAVKAGTKAEKPATIDSSDLAREGASALDAGSYKDWYNKKVAGTEAETYIAKPVSDASGNLSNVGTISRSLQSLKEGKLGGATFGSKVTQAEGSAKTAQLSGAEAFMKLNALTPDGNGIMNAVPDYLNDEVKGIRSNYIKSIAAPKEAIDQIGKITTFAKKDKITGKYLPLENFEAIAIVFTAMKGLDPGSVVRESEFAAVTGAGGIWSTLKSLINKGESGITIQPTEVASMVRAAELLQKAANRRIKEEGSRAGISMLDINVNPSRAIGLKDWSSVQKEAKKKYDLLNHKGK